MKIKRISAALTGMLVIASAVAATSSTDAKSEDASRWSRRGQLVYDIVQKWAPHVQEAYGMNAKRWTGEMGPLFKSTSLEKLQDAANARTFEQMNNALLGTVALAPAGDAPALIGDPDKDLVYTPVTPCRIIDTRVAGGMLNNNTSRDFDVTAAPSYTSQGGSATNCGIGDKGSFKAVVVSFTTTGAQAAGNLTAYPFGVTRPAATSMTYLPGQLTSNSVIAPLDQTSAGNEMTVFVSGKTHIIADVVGFFSEPALTPLECVEAAGAFVTRVNGGTINATGGNCPASYTLTGGECNTGLNDSVATDEDLVGVSGASQHYNCQVSDLAPGSGGSDTSVQAVSRCCRIPGA